MVPGLTVAPVSDSSASSCCSSDSTTFASRHYSRAHRIESSHKSREKETSTNTKRWGGRDENDSNDKGLVLFTN